MNARIALAWAAVILTLVVATLWWGWRRQVLWGNQIRNTVVFNDYRRALRTYHDANSGYPDSLAALPPRFRNIVEGVDRDQWGFPLIFESNGNGYVLASNGRRGEPDGHDYWELRATHRDDSLAVNICMNWTADQIASDRGWHQVCGK